MTSWEQHPHLFANGKFRIRDSCGNDFEVHSYEPESNTFRLKDLIGVEQAGDCTLIARRIEDMTDEEVRETPHYITLNTIEEEKRELEYKCRCGMLSAGDQNHLLSIGVYPFDQEHFDLPDDHEARVINARKQ